MTLDSTKHLVSQRNACPCLCPRPLRPCPEGQRLDLLQAASLCQAWTQGPQPQEGPAQWEVVLGDEGPLTELARPQGSPSVA